MCCFSRHVESVSGTKIFARSAAGERQFLVYSMVLAAKEELAMVLPLPVKAGSGEKAVEFIDLSGYADFFDDLHKGFPVLSSRFMKSAAPAGSAAPKLKVVSVGNFDASFVPGIADFARLDERFRLPPGTWDTLPAYRTYGFAVFKLKPGDAKVHPMAFTFPRADPNDLFFPTVHIHDGKLHDKADFDHTLYCQRRTNERFALTSWKESAGLAATFMKADKAKGIVNGALHCHKRNMSGTLPNKDTFLRIG